MTFKKKDHEIYQENKNDLNTIGWETTYHITDKHIAHPLLCKSNCIKNIKISFFNMAWLNT